MVTIIVNNSYSQILGLKTDEFRGLRKILSYETDPKAAYYMGGFTFVKHLIDKKGNFPSGLLGRVEAHLRKVAIVYTINDQRVKPRNKPATAFRNTLGVTPYIDQENAVNKALLHGRGGIVMPTGTGKSLVIAMLAGRLNVRTLVVVPNIEIRTQLVEQFSLFKLKNVTVVNIDSPKLKKMTDFDCLIIDECHHAAAKTYQNLNKTAWKGIYYRFFMSATFFRNQKNEQLLFEGIAGQEIYRVTNQRAVEQGYICPIDAYYYEIPKQNTDAHSWREVYSQLVVHNEVRNQVIADTLVSLSGKSTLCLVKEIAHGEILSELTGVHFANGQDEESRQYIQDFKNGVIKQLIGTTGIIGEGVDTKPCEYVIIAGLGKAKSAFMQQVGRAVRRYEGKESAKVILFKDSSHKFLLRHFKEQVKILMEEYGVEAIKVG